MKEYKLNWRFWFFFILFSVVVLIGIRVIYMMLTGQVVDENNEQIGFIFALFICFPLSLVLLTYLLSVISMGKLLIKNHGCGLKLTDAGIENTVVFFFIFAFAIIAPVKCIPWEAVKYYDYDKEDKFPYIRINTKMVQAGFFAKLLLKLFGYQFCHSFVKPNVTDEDINLYKHKFENNIK